MDKFKAVAEEALSAIGAIARSAQGQLEERGLSLGVMASINQATADALAKSMQDRNLERDGNLRALCRKPAIARLEVADEHGVVETIYITPNAEIHIPGIKLCSYLNNRGKGRLASLSVGEDADIALPLGTRNFRLRAKLTFEPAVEQGVWDSRPAVEFLEGQAPRTIKSLRELLRDDGWAEGEIDELERQLAEADAADNIVRGIQRSVLTAMQMRVQPLLDKYQDEIFRLPLDSRLAILGPPGSGKTTTLVKRLRQKLDSAHLDPEEQKLIEEQGTSGLQHAHSWLMFTPTTLLKEYVKAALSKEDVPVTDERIQTWDNYRHSIARLSLPILRSGKRKGMVIKPDSGILKADTSLRQIEWFESFSDFQQKLFLAELGEAASRIAVVEDPDVAAIGKQIAASISRSQGLPVRVLLELAGRLEVLQRLLAASREETRQSLRKILSLELRKDKELLEELARFISTLIPENEDELDDPDGEDDDDEVVPHQGLRAAEAAFYKALRAKAVADITKRAPAKTSRNAQVLTWLETRGLTLPPLDTIGASIVTQRAMAQVSRAPTNFVAKVPARYRRFRRESLADGKWYAAILGPADVDPLELDVVILAMLRASQQITANAQLVRRLDNRAPVILEDVAGLLRNQILVDEATDFSPIQLACMAALAKPGISSFFAIGDFNQRLTKWGVRSADELKWLFPNLDIRDVSIVYRQSRKLNEFANRLLVESTIDDHTTLPEFVENEGVTPVLGLDLADLTTLAKWLAERIREIERFSDLLPTIAVLVSHEDQLQPLADALNEALADQTIRAVACPKGQATGPETDVRIFEVQHIKGLEFEAIFFVDVDRLAREEPELFERYIYVGATRAATYLGLTCSGHVLPESMEPVSKLFGKNW